MFSAGLVSVLCCLFLLTGDVLAAGCQVSFNSPDGYVGEEITVNCSVNQPVAAATIRLSYDATCLEFVRATGSNSTGGGGAVLLDTDIGETATVTYSITFRALKAATSNIVVTGYDIVDGNGDPYEVSCGSSQVSIRTHSSDATLRGLSVSSGWLYPAFSADTTNYSVTVGNEVSSIAIQATVNNGEASVSVSGNRNSLEVGSNRVTVTVTAGDGTQKVYTVNVVREAAPVVDPPVEDSRVEKPVAVVKLGETEREIDSFKEEDIPAGFVASTTQYADQEIPIILNENTGRTAVWLKGEETDPEGFYWFDAEKGTAEPILKLTTNAENLIMLNLEEEQKAPEGYIRKEEELPFGKLQIFVPGGVEEPNHYLIYAINTATGKAGLYLFDREEETWQRYGFAVAGVNTEPVDSEPEDSQEESGEESGPFHEPSENGVFDLIREYSSWLLIGLNGILLIIIIALAVRLGHNRRMAREEETDEAESGEEADAVQMVREEKSESSEEEEPRAEEVNSPEEPEKEKEKNVPSPDEPQEESEKQEGSAEKTMEGAVKEPEKFDLEKYFNNFLSKEKEK